MAIGDHFYTINAAERDNAIASYGYRSDGTAGYVFGSDPSSLSPFYRLFHKRTGDHFYATSLHDRDIAIFGSIARDAYV